MENARRYITHLQPELAVRHNEPGLTCAFKPNFKEREREREREGEREGEREK